MASTGLHADSLIVTAGTEEHPLHWAGAIPGVYIEQLAAANGPGSGRLRSTGDGRSLSWRAPGSGSFGPPVVVTADGTYLLEDGDDPAGWARAVVKSSYLEPAPREARVTIEDRYGTSVSIDDVTAAEASAGAIELWWVQIQNMSNVVLSNLRGWLDAAVTGMEISEDAIAFSAPTTEATGLPFPDLAPAASDFVFIRRTITAGAGADPKVLNVLHLSFDGL